MAVPSYATDLASVDLCESGGLTWTEPTAAGWTLGAAPSLDTENFIQGSSSISKAFNATGVGGMMVNFTAGITLPADGAFFGWYYWASPKTLNTDALGGIRMMVGSSLANFDSWDVGGSTTYVYGGWINYAVNTTVGYDDRVGTGLGNSQYVGAAFWNLDAITKGSPCLVDAFRYGRGEARMNGGETDNYATFAGFAAANDATPARWGLIQAVQGSYLVKGLIIFGYGSAVDFRDANKALFIQNTNKVTANFNTFEVRQSGSRVDLSSITITALGTVSKGRWVTTDNATQNITSCVFTDMGVFGFASNSTLTDSTFRRCGLVTQNSATLTGCIFDSTADATKASLSNNPALISGCTFISGGTKHAIEIDTPGEYNFTNNSFTGYATTDGSTGNEVIYNNSGGEVIINHSGTTGVISVKNGINATTTVAVSAVLTIEVRNSDDGNLITQNCEVTVVKVSDESVLFHEDDITDGTTAYSYSSGSGTATYINVLNVSGYQNKTVYQTLAASNETAKVFLDTDRIFSNP